MTRQCGDCTLCCKLVPVRELNKGAGQRCKHQSASKGCGVYHKPEAGFPLSCALWSCRWLTEDDTADLRRPDRSRYVLDVMPDFVTMTDRISGAVQHIPVVQVWLDPKYPEAHRDPALRAFIERRGEEGMATLMRWDNVKAFTVFPPALCGDGEWHEFHNTGVHGETHTPAEVMAALGPMRLEFQP